MFKLTDNVTMFYLQLFVIFHRYTLYVEIIYVLVPQILKKTKISGR